MNLRKTLADDITIGAHRAYSEAVAELLSAQEEFSRITDENTEAYKFANVATSLAWDALTATVDAYCAQRVNEALRLSGVAAAAAPTPNEPEWLADASPEEISAFTPEQKALWKQQTRQFEDDFGFLASACENLYGSMRRYDKRMKQEGKAGNLNKTPSKPLYKAFDQVIAVHRVFQEEPDFLPRFLRHLPHVKEIDDKISARRKEKRRAAKIAKLQKLVGDAPQETASQGEAGQKAA